MLCNTAPLGTISVLSSCNTRPRLKCSYLIPTAHTVQILKRICCEKLVWTKSCAGLGRVPWRSSMCTPMKTTNSTIAKSCGAASHLSKRCSSMRSAMKSTQRVPARLETYNCFRRRQSTEIEFSNAACCSNYVTFFVLLHVEIRVGHVGCNVRQDFMKLKKSLTRDVLGVELGANTTNIVSSPMLEHILCSRRQC